MRSITLKTPEIEAVIRNDMEQDIIWKVWLILFFSANNILISLSRQGNTMKENNIFKHACAQHGITIFFRYTHNIYIHVTYFASGYFSVNLYIYYTYKLF